MFKMLGMAAVIVAVLLAGLGTFFLTRSPAPPSTPLQAIPVQSSAASTVFQVQPGASRARFMIDEVLRGSPNTVVGETDQVAGQIAFDPAHPSSAQAGAITINARTLATDENLRDRQIRNFILSTDEYELITFTPTAITGLPQSAVVGMPYPLQITGQLTMKGVTQEVTFDATATLASPTELHGTASTIIDYADWDIGIPSVPLVASVADQVRLELDLVATAA